MRQPPDPPEEARRSTDVHSLRLPEAGMSIGHVARSASLTIICASLASVSALALEAGQDKNAVSAASPLAEAGRDLATIGMSASPMITHDRASLDRQPTGGI